MKKTLNETLNNETAAVVSEIETNTEKKSRDTFSFRATPELVSDLTAIVKKFKSHKDALAHIVNVCEMDAARRVVSDSEAMIDSFQKHLIGIENDFLYALELKKNAENLAQESVSKILENKDTQIQDLQVKLEFQYEQINELKAAATLQKEAEGQLLLRTKNTEEALKKAENAIADKTQIIDMQKKQICDLEVMKSSIADNEEQVKILSEKLETAKNEILALKKENEVAERTNLDLTEKCNRIITEHQQTMAAEKEKSATACRAAAIEAREEAQKKIEIYIEKIEKKDDEIARLKAELMELKLSPLKKNEKEKKATQAQLIVE